MRTTYRIREPYTSLFLECAEKVENHSPVRPLRFIDMMKNNRGGIAQITDKGLCPDGLERRNPLVVALGDSVTAGHFESLLPREPEKLMELVRILQEAAAGKAVEMPPIEVTDARECYLEKFRGMLIDKYEQTSVSTVNAGLAGDNLISMAARAERDVISLQPDLVIINGSLNWDEESMGSTDVYKKLLRSLVRKIKDKTQADIVLLTPNGDLPNTLFGQPGSTASKETTTIRRVRAIRELAVEEQVCLADVYAVWGAAREAGCPWEELLANGINHPSVEGHEVYARMLMKLMD